MSDTKQPKPKIFDRYSLVPSGYVRPDCPWPEAVWPMTAEEYVKAVPDGKLRTAISGFLMRRGWEIACDTIEEQLKLKNT